MQTSATRMLSRSEHDDAYAAARRSAEECYKGDWSSSVLKNELSFWQDCAARNGQTHTAVARCEVLTEILNNGRMKLMSQQLRTTAQQKVVDQIVTRFGIDGSKVLFLNSAKPNEPWLRAKLMAAMARQSGKFKAIRVEVEPPIPQHDQVVCQGTVVDLDDHIYSLPGVATRGEKIAETEEEVSEYDLAESRALRSTLELAGFDPLDPTSVVPLGDFNPGPRDPVVAEVESRRADLARIHILGEERGLIDGKDYSGYRKFLYDHYNKAKTAADFDALQRKSLIEALERYVPPAVPEEFALLTQEAQL